MSHQQNMQSGQQEQGQCSSLENYAQSKQASNCSPLNQQANKQPSKTTKIKKNKKKGATSVKKFKMTSTSYKSKKCQFYNKGSCSKGSQCTFSHNFQPQASKKMCKFFLSGACTKGQTCPFSHNTKIYPCRFYHLQKLCKNGTMCRFSHENIKEDIALEYLQDNQQFLLQLFRKQKLTDTILLNYVRNSKLLEKDEQKYNGRLSQQYEKQVKNLDEQRQVNQMIQNQNKQSSLLQKVNLETSTPKQSFLNVNDPRIKRKLQNQKMNELKQAQKLYTQPAKETKTNYKSSLSNQKNQYFSVKKLIKVQNHGKIFRQTLITFLNSYF